MLLKPWETYRFVFQWARNLAISWGHNSNNSSNQDHINATSFCHWIMRWVHTTCNLQRSAFLAYLWNVLGIFYKAFCKTVFVKSVCIGYFEIIPQRFFPLCKYLTLTSIFQFTLTRTLKNMATRMLAFDRNRYFKPKLPFSAIVYSEIFSNWLIF